MDFETRRPSYALTAVLLLALGCGDSEVSPGGDAGANDDAATGADSGGSGGSGGESGGDGGGTTTRLTEPLPPGDPIDAPAGAWTWVDFPGTRCMNGSSTGLGIRPNPDSDELLIVMQGGGACFNLTTCLTAVNPNGFGEANLAGSVDVGLLDASDPDNPFADWNMVFIPYCSGDIFTGAAENGTGYGGRTQVGYLNIREYLTRLVPTYPDASHVVLSGYSAGGFASTFNWIQALEGWGPGVQVDVLNDSGPPMGSAYLTPCMQARLARDWNWAPSIPPDCLDCDLEAGNVTEPVLAWAIPHTSGSRHALISSTEDSVIKLFFGFGQNDCAGIDGLLGTFPNGLYYQGLLELQEQFADNPGAKAFIVDSTQHVWTMQSPGSVTSNGVVLRDWIAGFLDHDATWESVLPP